MWRGRDQGASHTSPPRGMGGGGGPPGDVYGGGGGIVRNYRAYSYICRCSDKLYSI